MRLSERFIWNAFREQAAADVAADVLLDEQIAERAGIKRTALSTWKQHPDFAARVEEIREATRQHILTTGIADRSKRVNRLNRDWSRMQAVIEGRAQAAKKNAERFHEQAVKVFDETTEVLAQSGQSDQERTPPTLDDCEEAPGMFTGLLVKQVKAVGRGSDFRIVEEFAVDTALLAELRNTELQAAKELGQLIERSDVTTNGKALGRVADMSEEALDDTIKRLEERKAKTPLS